ncbi:MAG TPA: hypothetical protein VF816_17135, partial [Rhodocyclaceae bacterium]
PLEGKQFSVTGYSLGGHLATAFNLLHYQDKLADGRYAVKEVVTFNGAGVGQIDNIDATAQSLKEVLMEFQDDVKSLRERTGEVKARLFTIPEVANLYEQIKAEIDPARLPDDASTQDNIRTRTAFALMRTRTAISEVENFSIDLHDLDGPSPAQFASEKATLLKALNDIAGQQAEALRIATFTAGGTGARAGESPQLSDPATTLAENLDYRLAVDLAAQRTESAAIVIGGIQAIAGKRYGTRRSNQYDVVGTETTGIFSYAAVANSQWHCGADVPVFIEDQPLYRGSVTRDAATASLDYLDAKLLVDHYANNDFADTHSLVLLVDSLNVQNALQQLAPDATQGEIETIFKNASKLVAESTAGTDGKCEGDVLETVVNALADLLLGPANAGSRLKGDPEGNTWWSIENIPNTEYTGRDAFYLKLNDVLTKAKDAQLLGGFTLAPSSPALKEQARDDFNAFAALYALSPFVLKPTGDASLSSAWGDLYSRWQADRQVPAGQRCFSDQWLADRAVMLGYWLRGNQANKEIVAPIDADQIDFKDARSGTTVTVRSAFAPDGPSAMTRNIAFGGTASERLDGGALADHLYGMDGDDILTANAGDDYLEGGRGDDELQGGEGNDTYWFVTGDGKDVIDDTDGGRILRNGKTLAAGVKVIKAGEEWKSADESVIYKKVGADLEVSFTDGADRLTLKNFDFG